MAIFAPQSRNGGKSYGGLCKVVPTLLFFLFFAYQHAVKAAREEATARTQELTFGNVLDCKPGKSGKFCHYVFQTVDEQSYVGGGLTSSDIEMGQTVDVYYDSRNPKINALESFSIKSRDDQTWAYIMLLVGGAVIAFGFSLKGNLHSERRSP